MSTTDPAARIERFYRLHSKIYDATRWSFLFGRAALIKKIAARKTPNHILEVGCGTGTNLLRLSRVFPQASLTGLDISQQMLNVAQRKLAAVANPINLIHSAYHEPLKPEHPFDLVLFSYSLSMMNPGWQQAIDAAFGDLAPGGLIAVVDFFNSPVALFKKWLATCHVRLDGHLLTQLKENFKAHSIDVHKTYYGLWSYFIFVGERKT